MISGYIPMQLSRLCAIDSIVTLRLTTIRVYTVLITLTGLLAEGASWRLPGRSRDLPDSPFLESIELAELRATNPLL